MDDSVLHVSIPGTYHDFFDYHACSGTSPLIGSRVWVPFRNKERMGLVVGQAKSKPETYQLKSIVSIIDETPVMPAELFSLCEWVSQYYHAPLAEVLALALPKKLRQGEQIQLKKSVQTERKEEAPLVLNDEQQHVVETIRRDLDHYHAYLLQGVTGSGKTEVYLHLITTMLAADKQVLMLVPEIGLTPQLLDRVKQRFNVPMAVIHSHISEGQRAQAWQGAKEGQVKLIIGTRSALFTPMPKLGLIIVDEEHDASLKQMEGVRYSARDTALMRAFQRQLPIVLGSATPSLESLHNVNLKKMTLLTLTHKALTQTPLHY
ncbi:MAG: DEAD/DEAH box helicase, partial [Legionellaceae bacterium]